MVDETVNEVEKTVNEVEKTFGRTLDPAISALREKVHSLAIALNDTLNNTPVKLGNHQCSLIFYFCPVEECPKFLLVYHSEDKPVVQLYFTGKQ